MEVLKFIAAAYLLFSAMILIAGAFFNIRVNRVYRILVIGIAFAVAVFGFCIEPTHDLDLYRLHRYARNLDFSQGNVIRSILGVNQTNISLAGTTLTGMISFNTLCYIVRLLGDLHWMSAISCIVTFGIVLSVIVDYVIETEGSSKQLFLALLITFMGMQVNYVMQGIRNAMAVAFCVLGIYLIVYKKKGGIIPYFLFILAATMHATVLIVLPIVFASKLKKQNVVRVLAFFTMTLLFFLANKSSTIGLGFINYLSERILFYTDIAYEFDRPEMIADVATFIVIGLSFWYLLRQGLITIDNEVERRYFNSYILLGIAMISCVQRRDFALRIGYLMGVGAIPMLHKLLYTRKEESGEGKIVSIGIVMTILVCSSKVAYDMWYVFSRWTFN